MAWLFYKSIGFLIILDLVYSPVCCAKGKQKGQCSEWIRNECLAKKGDCGPGFQIASRTGNCKGPNERRFKCLVPCNNERNEGSLESLEKLTVAQSAKPMIRPGNGHQKTRKSNRKHKRKDKAGRCRYNRGEIKGCDPVNKLINQVLTLRKGHPNNCAINKTVTRPCEGCKYSKGDGSSKGECDSDTNTREITLILKAGDAQKCAPTWTINRKCKTSKVNRKQDRQQRKAQKKKKKKQKQKEKIHKSGCIYNRKGRRWSECNEQTSTRTKTLPLKKGDPSYCAESKIITKKCKKQRKSKGCKYKKGEWSSCDQNSNKHRIDTIEGPTSNCPQNKTVTKKCKNEQQDKCRYDGRSASGCINGTVTVTKTLTSGPDSCEKVKTSFKSCGKCIFDKWGEFGMCQNGVKTKRRRVIQGGEKCERRAVKMRKCKD